MTNFAIEIGRMSRERRQGEVQRVWPSCLNVSGLSASLDERNLHYKYQVSVSVVYWELI